MRVLITGAAGRIGRVVAEGLVPRHQIRGLDLQEMPDLDDSMVGDVTDFEVCRRATEGM